jgi:hypothetical protein
MSFSSHPTSDNTPNSSTKATQKLTPSAPKWAQNKTTSTLWSWLSNPMQLPHATQLGLAAVGGALSVVMASLAFAWVIGRGEPIRDFFGKIQSQSQPTVPARPRAEVIVSKPQQSKANLQLLNAETPAVEPVQVEGANAEGTGLADFKPLTDEDRLRWNSRSEEARSLSERRLLEDKKRAIDRQLEDKQTEERRRQEDAQLEEQRRNEDKSRIEGWVGDDRKILEERQREEKEKREEEEKKLAEAMP